MQYYSSNNQQNMYTQSQNQNIQSTATLQTHYNQQSTCSYDSCEIIHSQTSFNIDEKLSYISETETCGNNYASQRDHSISYSSNTNEDINKFYNTMDIEFENSSVISQSSNQYSSYMVEGDFVIDFNKLETLLLQGGVQNQIDFTNSQINNWKKCVQIEKDSSENGCFYVSLDQKNESQLSSLTQIREMLFQLKERKIALMNQCDTEKFDQEVLKIENLLERIEDQKLSYQKNKKLNSIGYSDKYQQSVKKAKEIMRNIVNANGSTKSFVFAQLKAFDSERLAHEITQLIYSPKLISILYGNKNANSVFFNQIMRKGIIEMFDSNGHLTLNQLDSPQRTNSKVDSENGKVSLILYTNDNFQIPITVTLKKFNLSEEDSSVGAHELCVYDIKIKIKYQKQLNNFRKSQCDTVIKKGISKSNSSLSKKSLKKQNALISKNKLSDSENEDEPNQNQEFLGYYLETLGFLNKFYPEKLSENEKF